MLTIHMLGKAAAAKNGTDKLTFHTRKADAIFYYLIITATPVERIEVAELFWPEMTLANAQKNLRTVLPDLRNMLGDYLIVNNQQIAFNKACPHSVDLYQLQQLLADSSRPAQEKYAQYVACYQGELLAGLAVSNSSSFENWLSYQRQSLQQKIIIALHKWSESFLEQSAFKSGLEATQLWLKLQPWDENAHRLRMRLLWQNRQRNAALLQYSQCFEQLQAELGVEPSPETKKLYVQIQNASQSSPEKDKEKQAAPPTQVRHNLPNDLNTIIGREEAIATLRRFLLEQEHSLVSIIGEGGIGKTKLALAVAETLMQDAAQRYKDGIWFVSCAALSDAHSDTPSDAHSDAPSDAPSDARASQEQLCTLIGKTLGLQLQGGKATAEQVGSFLFQKSLLLIIDNFEPFSDHLDLLLPWVQKTKSLQILITSRHILNTQGDINLRLQGLEAPPFADYATTDKLTEKELSQLLRSPCAQILNERARKVWSKFTIDQHNGVAVAKLCSLLQGNPLALELAATLVIDYELDDIYQELTHNYNLLACELQDLPLRQRSIHNSIEYSWQLLPPDLATLLAQCSTLRNTFSYQTVSYITGEPVTKTVQLVFRSLLVTDPQRQLHIHELVRQFAARKLAEMPALFQRAHQKHSTLHISFLRDWWEKKESKHAVAKLLPQLENIYAAWDWAFQQQDFGALSRSTLAMTQFHIHAGLLWDMHVRANGYQQRLHEQISQSNQISLDSGPIVPEAFQEIQVALNQMRGILHFELSDYETATTLLQQSIEAATKHHYHYLLSNSECTLGNICRLTQRLSEAQQHYERAEQIAKTEQQPYLLIQAQLQLAQLANQQADAETSRRYLKNVESLLRQYPDENFEAHYQNIYGTLCQSEGRWSDALTARQKGMSTQTTYNSHLLHEIGRLFWQSGRYELAKEALGRITTSSPNSHYFPGRYWHTAWLLDFANLYIAWQQPEQALFYSQLARDNASKLGRKVLFACACKAEGTAQLQLEQWREAKENLTHAFLLFQQEASTHHECSALTQLIYLHLTLEEEAEITSYAEQIWQLLNSGRLDMTIVEPIKAWWACYLAFRALGDNRAERALHAAYKTFQTQLSHIHDQTWQEDFSSQIPEHRDLLRAVKELA